MMLVFGFFLGLVVEFIFARIGDKTCKTAAFECGFDCDKCTAHCVGYHCHLMRQEIIEQNNISDVKFSENESADL